MYTGTAGLEINLLNHILKFWHLKKIIRFLFCYSSNFRRIQMLLNGQYLNIDWHVTAGFRIIQMDCAANWDERFALMHQFMYYFCPHYSILICLAVFKYCNWRKLKIDACTCTIPTDEKNQHLTRMSNAFSIPPVFVLIISPRFLETVINGQIMINWC